MKTVGVIGAGLMGNGIAHVSALAGYDVILSDVSLDRAEAGKANIAKNLARQQAKGVVSAADVEATLNRITLTTDTARFAEADLVVEAATENEAVKKQIFADLCPKLRPETILATNTSSIPITRLAAATDRPDRFVGTHFFNPVPVMKLVEIIRSVVTSDATFATIRDLSLGLGKEVVVAKDYPGFIVNLLLIPYLLDAVRALELGIASKEDIDKGIQLGLNHPMGPLTLLDFVGLDTTLFIADAMFAETGDGRYAAPPLLRRMVSVGLHGRKAGRGFYEYGNK